MGKPGPQILLAFDFGLRRIGVATANRHTSTASPLQALSHGKELPWRELDALIAEWRPGQLLVGLPDPATAARIAAAAQAFAAALEERYGLPVASVDETLTSRAAQSEFIMARKAGLMKRRIRKGSLDCHAACLIAEQWLREQ
jgi:putative pre-16S rRNA nuclease